VLRVAPLLLLLLLLRWRRLGRQMQLAHQQLDQTLFSQAGCQ
jgi:hypothetical protein